MQRDTGTSCCAGATYIYTHTTLFTKAWQIQNIDISVEKEKNIYIQTNKINRFKVILTTVN